MRLSNENQPKLGILVLSIALQVFAYINSFFDEAVKVFWQFGGHSIFLKQTQDLVPGNAPHLRNAILISQDNTNLTRRQALLR